MNIVFIGNFRVSYSTENDLRWSLEKLGHQVTTFQEDEVLTDGILGYCQQAEVNLVIYVHTHTWQTQGSITLDEVWARLEEWHIPTASYHLDYWQGLARQGDVGNHPFWRTKYVFTADGGSDDWYRDKGINHFWLAPGVVERDCYYADPKDEFLYDVIFVGSRQYHPEWPYRPELLNWLEVNYHQQFAHFGNDGLRIVRGPELNRLYRTAKVVVGDSLCLDFKHKDYWSDRATETMGRGGFLIHPKISGMEDYFEDKKHIIYYDYGNFDQLKGLIDYYIKDYASRETIRLAGHLHTKENHTYTNRMSEMLEVIKAEEGI